MLILVGDDTATVPDAAVHAFGLAGPAVRLPGGQGGTWRVGGAVLKAGQDENFVRWLGDLSTRLDGRRDFRVSRPLPTRTGSWTADGWAAWNFEPGTHQPGRWLEVVEVGRRFHAAVRDEPQPALVRARADRWAVADRIAWGQLPLPPTAAGDPLVCDLMKAWRPVGGRDQLVHGDLTGNVLFHTDLPPLVIDLSPYWRPPGFATAVVLVDAHVWHGGDDLLLESQGRDVTAVQLLLRALLFRAVTDLLARPGDEPACVTRPYRPALEAVLDLSSRPS
jgi:uncharacterized protein (TIGR02569 family)